MKELDLTTEKSVIGDNLKKLRRLHQEKKEHLDEVFVFNTVLLYLERTLQAITNVIAVKKMEETDSVMNTPEEMFEWMKTKKDIRRKDIEDFKEIVRQVENSIHDRGNDQRIVKEIIQKDKIQVFDKILESI